MSNEDNSKQPEENAQQVSNEESSNKQEGGEQTSTKNESKSSGENAEKIAGNFFSRYYIRIYLHFASQHSYIELCFLLMIC